MSLPSPSQVHHFRKIIYNYFSRHARSLPWRGSDVNPYQILVSEVMLQQTQVARVIEKYEQFIKTFPDFPALSRSPLTDLLKVWQGMGYNRRALYLKKSAQMVMKLYAGRLPKSVNELISLPGIGHATAAAIYAYAFNRPAAFIETNIRTVYIHHFFKNKTHISDREILRLVEHTLDRKQPRLWYWALMDYGTYLKQTRGNLNTKSTHYRKQSPYATSNRRIRGLIIRALTRKSPQTVRQLTKQLLIDQSVISKNLLQLQKEGFLHPTNTGYLLVS